MSVYSTGNNNTYNIINWKDLKAFRIKEDYRAIVKEVQGSILEF